MKYSPYRDSIEIDVQTQDYSTPLMRATSKAMACDSGKYNGSFADMMPRYYLGIPPSKILLG